MAGKTVKPRGNSVSRAVKGIFGGYGKRAGAGLGSYLLSGQYLKGSGNSRGAKKVKAK